MEKENGFCALPFVQYSTYNGGRYRLCCMAKEPEQLVDQEELGIAGTWNHEYIKDVRKRMTSGEWLPECVECQHLERNGIVSSRQWENKQWTDKRGSDELWQFLSKAISIQAETEITLSAE